MFYVPTPVSNETTEKNEVIPNTVNLDFAQKYETEWQALTSERNLDILKNFVIQGKLYSSSIRSVYWRVLLGIFPVSSPSDWLLSVRKWRKEYNDIKNEFNLDPHMSSCVTDDNPLSQDENSVWSKYFCDTELKKVIQRDVVRTSSEKDFFQSPYIQDIMIIILFNYARKYPKICYRQGMHELLAPILFVIHEDFKAFERAKQISVINSFVSEIMDLNYLEADTFNLFSFIMDNMEKYYEVDNVPSASGHFPLPNLSKNNGNFTNNNKESAISSYLNTMRDETLAYFDRPLYNHLIKLNIPFTTFGIRWLRLLFGREFSFKDLLILWDAIFATNSEFSLVNYIMVAMLLAIREKLLISDYTECLNHLMKYPTLIDVKFIIHYAMYLQNPTVHNKPHLPAKELLQDGSNSSNTIYHSKSSKKHLNITKKLKNLKIGSSKKTEKENEFHYVDNYSSKTFEVVVTELKHMRVVMSLCKLKLDQYHEILTGSISSDDIKAQQALTGIQELCTLLDIDHFSLKPSLNNGPEVENAREADSQFGCFEANTTFSSHPTSDAVSLYLPPPKSEIDMKIFNKTESETTDFSRFPSKNPLKLLIQNK